LIIHIYFYEYFQSFKFWALTLQNILDNLSDVLEKCLNFSQIKIESVSLNPSQAMLGTYFSSVVYTFSFKNAILSFNEKLIFVFFIVILSNNLDFNQETCFTILVYSDGFWT
jgi:RNAse (barnase) inhibitor barstar